MDLALLRTDVQEDKTKHTLKRIFQAHVFEIIKSPKVQFVSASAGGCAVALGVVGNAVGVATGSLAGTAVGVVPSLFTFGLSVPVCTVLGGTIGAGVGTTVGVGTGLLGGGVSSGVAYAYRTEIHKTYLTVRATIADISIRASSRITAVKSETGDRAEEKTDAELSCLRSLNTQVSALKDIATAKALELCMGAKRRARDPGFQVTAASAAVGGAMLGASGSAAGLATGTLVGAAAGVFPAVFTLGLSIPLGAFVGGSSGLLIGAAAGGTVGAAGGGALGRVVHKKRQDAEQLRQQKMRDALAAAVRNRDVEHLRAAIKEGVSSDLGEEEFDEARRALLAIEAEAAEHERKERLREALAAAVDSRDVNLLRAAVDEGASALAEEELAEASQVLSDIEAEAAEQERKDTAREALAAAVDRRDVNLLRAAIDEGVSALAEEELVEAAEQERKERLRAALASAVDTRDVNLLRAAIDEGASALAEEELAEASQVLSYIEAEAAEQELKDSLREALAVAVDCRDVNLLRAAIDEGASALAEEELAEASQMLSSIEAEASEQERQQTVRDAEEVNLRRAAIDEGLPSLAEEEFAKAQQGLPNTEDEVPAFLSKLVLSLASRRQQCMLLSDLGSLLPAGTRNIVKRKGGLRSFLTEYPDFFKIVGDSGKESVEVAFEVGRDEDKQTGGAVCGDLRAAASAAADDAQTRQADEDYEKDCALQLRGLPYKATVSDIHAFLGMHAKFLRDEPSPIQVFVDRHGRSTGFARVNFESPAAAKTAQIELHKNVMRISSAAGSTATAEEAASEAKCNERYVEVFLFSKRPNKLKSKRVASADEPLQPDDNPCINSGDQEKVISELRRYVASLGTHQLLLSSLGVALSQGSRKYLLSQDSGLKHFLSQYPEEFKVEGKKGREHVIYLPAVQDNDGAGSHSQ